MKLGTKMKALEATLSLCVLILPKCSHKNLVMLDDTRATNNALAVGCRNAHFVGVEL
jgi:hypothetical protein